jgi:hypothetical protein
MYTQIRVLLFGVLIPHSLFGDGVYALRSLALGVRCCWGDQHFEVLLLGVQLLAAPFRCLVVFLVLLRSGVAGMRDFYRSDLVVWSPEFSFGIALLVLFISEGDFDLGVLSSAFCVVFETIYCILLCDFLVSFFALSGFSSFPRMSCALCTCRM